MSFKNQELYDSVYEKICDTKRVWKYIIWKTQFYKYNDTNKLNCYKEIIQMILNSDTGNTRIIKLQPLMLNGVITRTVK